MPMIAQPEIVDEVYYPSSDGKPMGETQIHNYSIGLLMEALKDHLRTRTDVCLATNLFLYWERGNRSACTAPDVMVIPGVRKAWRSSFKVWEEGGAVPSVIFEVASENTWREHLTENRGHYERLGVAEFFLFDPEHRFLEAPLLGFRLRNERYEVVEADSEGGMICKGLNLRLLPEGWMLRLIDLATGVPLLTVGEKHERQERLLEEKDRRLKDKDRRLKEKDRRLEAERLRAEEMAAEIARLKALLKDSTDDADGNR